MKVTVLGAGAMGSALTIPLTDNDNEVTLWGSRFDEDILEAVRAGEPHPRIDRHLPEELDLLGPEDLEDAVKRAETVVLGVSSSGVVPVVRRIAPYLEGNQGLVSIAKGLLEVDDSPHFIQNGIRRVLEQEGAEVPSLISVGGPSIAVELAHRSRTAVAYASENESFLAEITEVFSTEYYTIKATDDVRGVDVCIGYKNSYSIALAWPNGLAESKQISEGMTNFRAILFLRTLEELKTIARSLNGKAKTVYQLAGLGDLVTTTAAGRNGTFGKLLGSGKSATEALQIMENRGVGVIEGYDTADLGAHLIRNHKQTDNISLEDLPLLREINNVLYNDKPVEEAIDEINV